MSRDHLKQGPGGQRPAPAGLLGCDTATGSPATTSDREV